MRETSTPRWIHKDKHVTINIWKRQALGAFRAALLVRSAPGDQYIKGQTNILPWHDSSTTQHGKDKATPFFRAILEEVALTPTAATVSLLSLIQSIIFNPQANISTNTSSTRIYLIFLLFPRRPIHEKANRDFSSPCHHYEVTRKRQRNAILGTILGIILGEVALIPQLPPIVSLSHRRHSVHFLFPHFRK